MYLFRFSTYFLIFPEGRKALYKVVGYQEGSPRNLTLYLGVYEFGVEEICAGHQG